MKNEPELNALIGSRICHDLISPLGAIGNGIELLTMSGAASAPEISLISESVESANARIRFFRIAFGAADSDALIGNAEIKSILADFFRENRTKLDWRISQDLRRAEAKLAFLLIQCLENALPWGGNILATLTDNTWSLSGTGDRLKIDESLWNIAVNPQAELEVKASEVQFALVQPAAQQIGRSVKTIIRENGITVSF